MKVRRMSDRSVTVLLEILLEAEPQGLPIEDARALLKRRVEAPDSNSVDQVIQYALDNWLVDKTIDYCRDSSGEEVGELRWFLRPLGEDESKEMRALPEIKKEIIRILRGQDTERGIGMIRAEELLSKLREKGFDPHIIPTIENRVSDVFKTEDDKLVEWYYLVPQFELTEEYKQMNEELDEISLQKELRREREG